MLNARAYRFAVVAAAGFVVQIAVLQGLITWTSLPQALAIAVAVESAIVHNFFWHERWTFGRRGLGPGGRWQRFARFNGVTAIVSIAGNVVVTEAIAALAPLTLAAANAAAVAVLGLVNFVVSDPWTFEARTIAEDSHPRTLPRVQRAGRG